MALPPAHLFVGAAAAECARSGSMARWKAWGVGALVAVAPDLDSVVLLALGRGAAAHGLYTHTLLATVGAALLTGGLAGVRWGAVVGGAYLSHLVVDSLRASSTTRVFLAWPWSDHAVEPIAPIFVVVPFEWGAGPGLLPKFYGADPLGLFLQQTAVGLACFAGVAAVSYFLRRR